MPEIAERIAADLEPRAGWLLPSTRAEIIDVANTMLAEGMDEDTVDECLRAVFRAVSSEYGE